MIKYTLMKAYSVKNAENTSPMQTKRQSFIESCMNIFSGMIISFSISQLAHVSAPYIQKYIYSGFIWNLSATSNIIMTVLLTVISIIRSYAWRRYFNYKHSEQA